MRKFVSVLFLLFLLAGSFGLQASPEDSLVDTEWLSKNLENPKIRLIEVSVDPGVYEKGHIKGAINFRWHTDLVDQPRRDIVSKEKFKELVSKAGIDNDSTVVLYGDNNNWFATWGAWIFHYYGHKDVKILNGGRKKWELEKRPLASETPNPTATAYKISGENKKLRAKLPDVLKAVESKNKTVLLDIRSPDEFSGKVIAPQGIQELAIRAGHVPGAVNLPWAKAVNQDDGTFKPVAELKKLYSEAGVDGSKPVIVYCRIGERSSHSWFVLSKLLGYEAKQYDGSWTEYGNSVGVPIDNPSGSVWTGK
ncbi:sulfurtransferase [Leptospira saintgironsiae]|uniref:Sulfurtransferase n=1 Tax=Leptospira saintgironsiae TaxID=2023183 RepID=A0A2M9YDW1_9LEPT|nr:sulfurtransferase [Leptospira saintgironsiae]PJZ49699.1 sulfurtransferase [Leptospira saintgironsiae]